ncbi:MAG: hypothetical protein M3238_00685 [Actinomycetota bacterium]|nr:hypothetical protein [Actinomycetota bacterium]
MRFRRVRRGIAVLSAAAALSACSGASEPATRNDGAQADKTRFDVGEPYPYAEPAPPRETTAIDGIYERTITVRRAGGRPVYCQRCAPWRLDAGSAAILFDRGRLYAMFDPIRTEVDCRSETLGRECKKPPGFDVSAHYRVEGDRIEIFNDPNCIGMTGVYEWRVEDDVLILDVVEDACPFVLLRARYLTAAPWQRA